MVPVGRGTDLVAQVPKGFPLAVADPCGSVGFDWRQVVYFLTPELMAQYICLRALVSANRFCLGKAQSCLEGLKLAWDLEI